MNEEVVGHLQSESAEERERALDNLPRPIPETIVRLVLAIAGNDEEPTVRVSALRALGVVEPTPELAELLRQRLSDSDWRVRRMAVQLLARIGSGPIEEPPSSSAGPTPPADPIVLVERGLQRDSRVLPALIALFQDPDARLRDAVETAIVGFGRLAVDAILGGPPADSADSRSRLATLLGSIGQWDRLIQVLGVAEDWRVRQLCVRALGVAETTQALQALFRATEDQELRVARTAWESIGLVPLVNDRYASAVSFLRQSLGRPKTTPKLSAARAVLRVGGPGGLAVADETIVNGDVSAQVAMMQALMQSIREHHGLPRSYQALQGSLLRATSSRNDWTRVMALHTLRSISDVTLLDEAPLSSLRSSPAQETAPPSKREPAGTPPSESLGSPIDGRIPTPRFLDATLFDGPPSRQRWSEARPLLVGHKYALEVAVRDARTGVPATGDTMPIDLPAVAGRYDLLVVADSRSCTDRTPRRHHHDW